MRRDLQSELKKLHECNPEVGVVHNGKTALEWCELYFAATAELEALKKMERDRWTGWAKSMGLRTTPWVAQSTPPTEEGRSFEASYLAIRAAGGDAWDGLDVAKELAEIRGCEAADDEADGSQQ